MDLKIKRLVPEAVMPKYAKAGDAAVDLVATSVSEATPEECANSLEKALYVEYGTGLAMEIPEGHVGLLFPRSSVSKTGWILSNCVGVIDSGYRGEVKIRFSVTGAETRIMQDVNRPYEIGDRIAQLMIIPIPQLAIYEVQELSSTDRSEGGFGSTGK